MNRIIKDFPEYTISEDGKVFKDARQISSVASSSGKYRKVCLFKNGKKYFKDVHRLVASEFIGNVSGMVVNHIDFDGHNNHYLNLEIVTQKQNVRHTINNQRHCHGKNHFRFRITDKDLFLIYHLKAFGFTFKEIEKELNLTNKTACVALTNRILKYEKKPKRI